MGYSICQEPEPYPNTTTKDCGIGLESSRVNSHIVDNDQCFPYHKSQPLFGSIQNGRDVAIGEMPWVVYYRGCQSYINGPLDTSPIKIRCGSGSGSVLNNRWIITCAHNLVGSPNKKDPKFVNGTVYPGAINKNFLPQGYSVYTYFIHPNYSHSIQNRHDYDLALIKTDQEIKFIQQDGYYKINSICLPKANVVNKQLKYALIAGWGLDNYRNLTQKLQMGPVIVDIPNATAPASSINRQSVVTYTQFNGLNGALPCQGDSGAPVFEYSSTGRAVLLGIHVALKPGSHYCLNANQTGVSVRVSLHIQWILDTIKNNTP